MKQGLAGGILLLLLVFSFSGLADARNQFSIVSKLYQNGRHPQEPHENGDILDIAAWEHFFYVSWIDTVDRDLHLDVWDLKDPIHPIFVTGYPFGNARADRDQHIPDDFLKSPKSMKFVDGTLVFWSNFAFHSYKPLEDGRLEKLGEYPLGDIAHGLASVLTPFHIEGHFATSFRNSLLYPHEIREILRAGILSMEDLAPLNQGYGFINLNNPKAPFVVRGPRPYEIKLFYTDQPLNATFEGNPATITISEDRQHGHIDVYAPNQETFVTSFWRSKFSFLFKPEILDLSLNSLIAKIIGQYDLPSMQDKLINAYKRTLSVPEGINLHDLVLLKHGQDVPLDQVLTQYGIHLDDSLELALDKIIEAQLTAELEASVSAQTLREVALSWKRQIFNLPDVPIKSLKLNFIRSMNAEIDAIGVAPYFVLHVVSPMLNNPPFMSLTLDDLVKQLGNSAAGMLIDNFLRIFHAILPSDLVLNPLGFQAPACLRIPNSSVEFLRLALYEHGAKLNPAGLAFFELIKLTQYFSNNNQYLQFDQQLRDMLHDFHQKLANNVFDEIVNPLDPLILEQDSLDKGLEKFSKNYSLKRALSIPIRESLKRVLTAANIPIDKTIREFFDGANLHVDPLNLPIGQKISTIKDWVIKMDQWGIGPYHLTDLLNLSKSITLSPLKEELQLMLKELFFVVLGADFSGEATFQEMLYAFYGKKLDFQLPGDLLHGLLNRLLNTHYDDGRLGGTITGWLPDVDRASKGDCIALWKTTLDAMRLVALGVPGLQGVAGDLTVTIENLGLADVTANRYFISTMVGTLASEIIGGMGSHYGSWVVHLQKTSYDFDIAQMASFVPALIDSFAWRNRIVLVLRNVRHQGKLDDQGHVALLIFDPRRPLETKQEIDLGAWENYFKASQMDEWLLLGGDKQFGNFKESYVMMINLDEPTPSVYEAVDVTALGSLASSLKVVGIGSHHLAAHTGGNEVILFEKPANKNLQINLLEANLPGNNGEQNNGGGNNGGGNNGGGNNGGGNNSGGSPNGLTNGEAPPTAGGCSLHREL